MIWGAGGHGKVVLDIARSTAHFDTILFADEDQTKENVVFQECEVVTDFTGLYRLAGSHFVIAIGNNHVPRSTLLPRTGIWPVAGHSRSQIDVCVTNGQTRTRHRRHAGRDYQCRSLDWRKLHHQQRSDRRTRLPSRSERSYLTKSGPGGRGGRGYSCAYRYGRCCPP